MVKSSILWGTTVRWSDILLTHATLGLPVHCGYRPRVENRFPIMGHFNFYDILQYQIIEHVTLNSPMTASLEPSVWWQMVIIFSFWYQQQNIHLSISLSKRNIQHLLFFSWRWIIPRHDAREGWHNSCECFLQPDNDLTGKQPEWTTLRHDSPLLCYFLLP